ncbi:HEAT repeat domain-containing protein [Methanococcoides orientis]|uniref:HEAT repeat domain-containing protein n=1 Tax=Methanococcoides orientis TaxID=2822137 RepID=UPI001E3F651D|nr:HEAT repeat domain-containing protein [Methanococcoides orientis]UGV41577.1 HEAT repeat domain-containing protein [Methanococcoides orientis]
MIESLIQNTGHSTVFVRVDAVKSLVEIGGPAVDPLIQALNDEKPKIRENSAAALGKIGDERAVQPLINLLGDDDNDVQRAAEFALCDIGDQAVEPLVEAINDPDVNWAVHSNGMRVLETIGDERAVGPLIEMLGGVDGVDAATALGEIGEPAVEPLIDALGDEDPHVRAYAARALGRTGDSRAVEPVIELLNDEDENVKSNAAMALGKLDDKRAIEPLTKALDGDSDRVRILARSAIDDIERQVSSSKVMTFYGEGREFYTEDERRSWLDKLESMRNIMGDMQKYMHPYGPVISYGQGYDGYISVTFLEGSEVNESLMDEIYGVIDKKAVENGIDDIPVKFEFEEMPVLDEAPCEDLIEEDIDTPNTPGFTIFSLIMGLLFVLKIQK